MLGEIMHPSKGYVFRVTRFSDFVTRSDGICTESGVTKPSGHSTRDVRRVIRCGRRRLIGGGRMRQRGRTCIVIVVIKAFDSLLSKKLNCFTFSVLHSGDKVFE